MGSASGLVLVRRAAVGLLLFALFQEAVLRAVFPLADVLNFDRHRYAHQAFVARENHPRTLGNVSFTWASDPDGFEFVHRLNLYGFRDRQWTLRARDGETRIAFVGDSFVEGFSSDAENTIPSVFGRLAEEAGRGVDVLNLGLGGAGVRNYVDLIRDAVPIFRPDVVILVFYENDLLPNSFRRKWLAQPLKPETSNRWRPRLLHVLSERSAGRRIPRRWTAAPFSYLAAVPDPTNAWSHADNVPKLERVVDPDIAAAMRVGRFNPAMAMWAVWAHRDIPRPVDYASIIRGLATYTERYGAVLRVVYVPTKSQVTDRYRPFFARFTSTEGMDALTGDRFQVHALNLSAACRTAQVPFLDLSPLLREREAAGPPLYWDYDDHFRPQGYRAAAGWIFDWWAAG